MVDAGDAVDGVVGDTPTHGLGDHKNALVVHVGELFLDLFICKVNMLDKAQRQNILLQ